MGEVASPGRPGRAAALVVPVGGTLEAPLRAIQEVSPRWVAFLASRETRAQIEQIEARLGRPLEWKRVILTPDAQDLGATYREVETKLRDIVAEWGLDWEDVVVDLTGGTKVMVAALVLGTVHRVSRYLYVGGGERDRGGTGVVVTGTERPIQAVNPWENLGSEHHRRIAWAFNRLQFAAAAELAERTARRVARERRAYFEALARLIHGFAAWDRFEYREARARLERVLDTLALEWSRTPGHGHLTAQVEACLRTLEGLAAGPATPAPSEALLRDLLANAVRRGEVERRFDDAVARLYRFLEGVAQRTLWEEFGIRTGAVPASALPPDAAWDAARTQAERGVVQLGLRRAYELLRAKGHRLGSFAEAVVTDSRVAGLLAARNHSLLAHGTRAVGEREFAGLLDVCLELAGWRRDELTVFPKLPEA
jgi:CRISPR-associated protein (TIGR02710 family)